MKYRCNHCKKEFDLPATLIYQPVIKLPLGTTPVPPTNPLWHTYVNPPPTNWISYNYQISQPCCPHCHSTDIEEAKEG